MGVGWKSVLSRGTATEEPPKQDLPDAFRELQVAGAGAAERANREVGDVCRGDVGPGGQHGNVNFCSE